MGKRKWCRVVMAGSCVAFICWLLAGASVMAGSVNHASVTAGHDHSVGIHGMVLVKAGEHLLASIYRSMAVSTPIKSSWR